MPLYNDHHYGKNIECDNHQFYAHEDDGMIVINFRKFNDPNDDVYFLLSLNHHLDGNAFGLRKHCGPIIGVDLV